MLLVAKDTGWEGTVAKLHQFKGVETAVHAAHSLPCDFVWFAHHKKMGIELKRAGDLLSSLSGRLAGQAKKMVEKLDFGIVLIAGRIEHERATGKLVLNGIETRWDYRSWMGMRADLGMIGVYVEEWDGQAEERVAAWYLNSQKEDHAWLRGRTRPQLLTLDVGHRDAVWSLCAWEGIGVTTAERLLEKYGTASKVYQTAAMHKTTPALFCKGIRGFRQAAASTFLKAVNS